MRGRLRTEPGRKGLRSSRRPTVLSNRYIHRPGFLPDRPSTLFAEAASRLGDADRLKARASDELRPSHHPAQDRTAGAERIRLFLQGSPRQAREGTRQSRGRGRCLTRRCHGGDGKLADAQTLKEQLDPPVSTRGAGAVAKATSPRAGELGLRLDPDLEAKFVKSS